MKALIVINSELFDIYPLDDVRVIYTIQIKDSEFNFAHGIGNLKPMPERINPLKVDSNNLLDLGYMHGRNDLINQMEGDENE